MNIKKYIINRLTRLYVVLIPALFLSFIFALVLIYISNTEVQALTIKDFFGSLFFLQTILTEPFAHNGPLWSLANEFWYYVLFPLMTFVYYNKYRYIAILFLVGIFILLPIKILLYFIIYLIGVGTFSIKRKLLPIFISFALFFISLIVARLHLIDTLFISDLFIAISFSLLINSLVFSKKNIFFEKIYKFNKDMAGFSYSLYLLHMPIVYLFIYILKQNFSFNNLNINNFMIFLLSFFIIIFYACFISRFTEANTNIVRDKIYKIAGIEK